MMHTEDLRKVVLLWLKYTEDVRFDPDVRLGFLSIKIMQCTILFFEPKLFPFICNLFYIFLQHKLTHA